MTLKAVVVMNSGGFDENAATKRLQDFVKGKTAAVQISARGEVYRRVAEDRHGED